MQTPMDNKYYIIQATDDWWTVGMEYQENGRTNIGRAPGMEEPFASLTCYDNILSTSITLTRDGVKQEVFVDGRSAMFPTKKSLVESLQRVGFTEGEQLAYNCRKIIKYDPNKAKEEVEEAKAQASRKAKKMKKAKEEQTTSKENEQ